MNIRLKTPALLLGLAVMALGAPASAQVIKVPNDHATIQEAVDAASAGDTIQVSSGTYVENVVIGESLDGLTIQGKGKVMVDGIAVEGEHGITINSSNVTLKGLTIRHAGGAGVSAFVLTEGGPAPLTGVVLDKLTIINCEDEGIILNVDGAKVINCKTNGCDGGIEVNGAGAEITRSEVHNDADEGIRVDGNGATISRCTVDIIEDGTGIQVNGNAALVDKNNVSSTCSDLIQVFGANAVVTRNKLTNGDSDGIDVEGDNALVDKNNITGVCGTLINVEGNNAMVTSNKVSGSDSDGIDVSGNNPTVSKNTVTDTGDDDAGIDVDATLPGGTVEQNKVSDAFQYGYNLRLSDALISKNQATKCGSEDEGGFLIRGDDNTIDNNKAMDCDSNGFVIIGNTNSLSKNQAKGNTVNGIFIVSGSFKGEGIETSTSNRLTSNTCTDNQGQGLDNQGFGTIIEKNKLSKNRQDLTNRTSTGATYVDNGGNKFTTGGLTTEADIEGDF